MGNSPTVSQLPLGMCAETAYLYRKETSDLKLASQNFPIIEKCDMRHMKYALGHPPDMGYTGTVTKELWLLGKHALCFLSCLFPLVSGFPTVHGYQKKARRTKHSNI